MGLKIITDSASDITQKEAKEKDIQVIPLKTMFGEESFLDGVTLSNTEFFKKLEESDELPHTSQVSPIEYKKIFQEIKDNNDTAICIILSSKLSGSFQSALVALEGFEDIISIIDSENVSIGEKILVEHALKLRNQGFSLEEITKELNKKKKDIRVIALLDTLEYLKKGGRISSTTAFMGKLLSIKPVVAVENGEVVLLGKARGSKKGENLLRKFIKGTGGIDFSHPFSLAYSGFSDEILKDYIENSKDLYEKNIQELPVVSIGSTIGTHVGSGAIAAAFYQKK